MSNKRQYEDLKNTSVKKGDLVLLIQKDPPRADLAIFKKFRWENDFFIASKYLSFCTPESMGTFRVPNVNKYDDNSTLSCFATKIYIGKQQIIKGLKAEPLFELYAPFLKHP